MVRDKGYFWECIPCKTLNIILYGKLVVIFVISTFRTPILILIASILYRCVEMYFPFALLINEIVKVKILKYSPFN